MFLKLCVICNCLISEQVFFVTINCGAVDSDHLLVMIRFKEKRKRIHGWVAPIGSFAFWMPSIMADYNLNLGFVLLIFFIVLFVFFTRD